MYKSSLSYNGELILKVIFSFPSTTQGPRGLPGERGRPGPSGVAVSFVFLTKIYNLIHNRWIICFIALLF